MKKTLALLTAATAALAISVLPAATASAGTAPTQTIAEIASGDPQFSTLVAALGAADLVGPFDSCDDAKTTVFAPTNDAFAAALAALGMTAEQLLADTDLLTSVLTYHVVSGEVDAATVVGLTEATTLNGAKIMIKVEGGSVFLNDTVQVTATDIRACNGIIHVIDAVLLPPAGQAPAGEMPATGSATDGIVLAATLLLAGGVASLLISRRRRPVTA